MKAFIPLLSMAFSSDLVLAEPVVGPGGSRSVIAAFREMATDSADGRGSICEVGGGGVAALEAWQLKSRETGGQPERVEILNQLKVWRCVGQATFREAIVTGLCRVWPKAGY